MELIIIRSLKALCWYHVKTHNKEGYVEVLCDEADATALESHIHSQRTATRQTINIQQPPTNKILK
jgi:hypothetical protein